MQHLSNLIYDLALILASAAAVSLVFKWLKQPVVLGYIIAGFLVGPNFNLFPTVVEIEGVKTWAEIGVLFLLFGLGLEFSFRKLVKVGGVAAITAVIGVGLTMLSGYSVAKMLGWSEMDSLFLGGILAIASTTIIIKAFDESNIKSQKFAGVVMGILVVEDMVAVVLMVILSTVSISRSFQGMDMIYSILKLLFFLVLWFISGIYFLPTLLKKTKSFLNDETLLILSLALCFLMVVLATYTGFSPALGAFIMGSLLAETVKAEKIELGLRPLKNLFGAIFFVSVGMLIVPEMLVKYYFPILIATLILLIGKPLFITVGSLITGQPLKVAIRSGMSLSQIGEFSFIIATMGLSLNVTSDFLYPIAVAVSVVTTFTTPYMIRISEPAYRFIESRLPEKWVRSINNYSLNTQKITEASDWRKLLKAYFINITVLSVIIISIILLSTRFLSPLIPDSNWKDIVITFITLVFMSPFLWALAVRRTHAETIAGSTPKYANQGPLIILMFSRILLAFFYIGFLFQKMYSPIVAISGIIITSIILLLIRKRIKKFYGKIESRFLMNLNHSQEEKEAETVLAPWDSHLATFELNPLVPFIGKTLVESRLREAFGINVAVIKRGDLVINVPGRFEKLYPNDILSVIGTDEQLNSFRDYIETSAKIKSELAEYPAVALHHFTVSESSALNGKSIKNSAIRELTKGLIVGVERDGERILNPESDFILRNNDAIWIVGNEKRLQVFLKEN